jgi:hypothetical protein
VKDLGEYDDGSKYFDLKISPDCINGVILGPEMSESDIKELNAIEGVIRFPDLHTTPSTGTNVIRNR